MTIDLSDDLKSVSVPYMIFQGDCDIVTSTKMLSQFVQIAKNDNLIFKIVENSAHMPSALGMDAIIQTGFSFLEK